MPFLWLGKILHITCVAGHGPIPLLEGDALAVPGVEQGVNDVERPYRQPRECMATSISGRYDPS